MVLTKNDVIGILARIASRMIEKAEYLSELDGVSGDGEHGINMEKGFREVLSALPDWASAPPGEIFKRAGKLVMTKTGGSAGILYGTMLLEMSKAVGDAEEVDAPLAAEMFRRALDGVRKRGGAQVGDKTLVDTLHPAVMTLAKAAEGGAGLAACFRAAEEAARKGMDSTMDLAARKGRASYQGENSRGALDPGAVSMYYFFEQIRAHFSEAV